MKFLRLMMFAVLMAAVGFVGAYFVLAKNGPLGQTNNPAPRIGGTQTEEAPSGDTLTRTEAKQILDNEARDRACESDLAFLEGGAERAIEDGVMTVIERHPSGRVRYKLGEYPAGVTWYMDCLPGLFCGETIEKSRRSKVCLDGEVEIRSIADAPIGQGSESYKVVEFIEVVTLPSELQNMGPYVYTRYIKTLWFQRTDVGWRVAPRSVVPSRYLTYPDG